jgi:hypothetical protein
MQKGFKSFFMFFFAIRHTIRKFCLIWSYIYNKVQKDAKRREKTRKLRDSNVVFLMFMSSNCRLRGATKGVNTLTTSSCLRRFFLVHIRLIPIPYYHGHTQDTQDKPKPRGPGIRRNPSPV